MNSQRPTPPNRDMIVKPETRSIRPRGGRVYDYLNARWFDTPAGGMFAVAGRLGLRLLYFVENEQLAKGMYIAQRATRRSITLSDNEHLVRTRAQLSEYFAGTRRSFDLKLDLHGTEFQHKVWEAVQEIPYAQSNSYAAIAQQIGDAGASRAVGFANSKNPILIIVPCHRVVRSDGTLCGYAGGVERKRWLLDHEAKYSSGTLYGQLRFHSGEAS